MQTRNIASLVALLGLGVMACDKTTPVDNAIDNPGVLGPTGVMRGSVAYIGPGPCVLKGRIEGMLVLLIFDAKNPPPPDGLATTALNFATIPGEALFPSYPRPSTGPGSSSDAGALCPAPDSPVVTASATFAIPYIAAGHYQLRAFYSRQSRFNPLFDYSNLPLAGDIGGGALVDPRTGLPDFATIDVGVPATADAGAGVDLVIPPEGFVRDGISVLVGSAIPFNRPYFSIDIAGTLSYDLAAFDADPGVKKATGLEADAEALISTGVRKSAKDLNGAIVMRQDHATTSKVNLPCLGSLDPSCSALSFAQASFPQIRLKYGFPGDATKITADRYGADAWLAANAAPATPFAGKVKKPYYGIDPLEFSAGVGGTPKIPTSGSFVLSRAVNPVDGTPDLLHDNADLEATAKIANLFPLVLLAKLVDDGEGNVLSPPRAQTDPVVLVQTFTLNQDSLKATSTDKGLINGGLSDPKSTLNSTSPSAIVPADAFSILVRPAALCLYPDSPKGNFKGAVVSPMALDPNPNNTPLDGSKQATLVDPARVLKYNALHVSAVEFGCLPAGTYAINVVFPSTGQAWSLPNLLGHPFYDAQFRRVEDAIVFSPASLSTSFAFGQRPLLQSQSLYVTDAAGSFVLDKAGSKIPQVLVIEPSLRCGAATRMPESGACSVNADCTRSGLPFLCVADPVDGKKYCDLNGNGVIDYKFDDSGHRTTKSNVVLNNPLHEDANHNGLLDPGEDKNGNGKLDMRVPNICLASFATYSLMSADDQKK